MTKVAFVLLLAAIFCLVFIGFELRRLSTVRTEVRQAAGWIQLADGEWQFLAIGPPHFCTWNIALSEVQIRMLSNGIPCRYVAPEHLVPRLELDEGSQEKGNG